MEIRLIPVAIMQDETLAIHIMSNNSKSYGVYTIGPSIYFTPPSPSLHQEYDSIRDTIEESWDQEPEARLSAQCIAERIRMFKLSKFGSKDSGLTETDTPTDLTCNSESMDSQLAPTTPSLSSSRTMSPMTSKNCMLDSGTESLGIYPGQAFSTETVRLGGTNSSNSSFLLSSRSRGSGQFNPPHHHFCGGGLSRCGHHHHHHHTAFSNRAMYNIHSTETTV